MTNEINLYSKEQTDALLVEKEDAGTAYTKAETDALLDEKEDVGTTYTKAQTDALLAGKEDAGLSYTKAQVDGLLADKATYGEVVELGGSSYIGSDLRPIKIVNGVAVAVANPLIDTETAQTINAQKTFAANPKAAAPASGAVDTSVVNANWASQTGDDSPNNLLHNMGNETALGFKTWADGSYIRPVTTPNSSDTTLWVKVYTSASSSTTKRAIVLITGQDDNQSGIVELRYMNSGGRIHWWLCPTKITANAIKLARNASGTWELWLRCTGNNRVYNLAVLSEISNAGYASNLKPVKNPTYQAEPDWTTYIDIGIEEFATWRTS